MALSANDPGAKTGLLPFATLLSQALVAFTLELDNDFEQRMPHRTTDYGKASGNWITTGIFHPPWLVSLVMWTHCLQHVPQEGITVRRLEAAARTNPLVEAMDRWGYVMIQPYATKRKIPLGDCIVLPTDAGWAAREIWLGLFEEIEARWKARFGQQRMDDLRHGLCGLVRCTGAGLPDGMPILGYGLVTRCAAPAAGPTAEDLSKLPVSALLSRVLTAFALEFEAEAEVSLALGANVLRVLACGEVSLADLPELGGVSVEAVSMAMGVLQKRQLVTVELGVAEGAKRRARLIHLTDAGYVVWTAFRMRQKKLEQEWLERYPEISLVREVLEPFAGDGTLAGSAFAAAVQPPPECWRARPRVARPGTLPHFPMVLHRGGFPDGA